MAQPSTTSTPIERAVPSMISCRFDIVRIQIRHFRFRDLSHLALLNTADNFSADFGSAFRQSSSLLNEETAGGVLVMNENVRSAYAVMITGIGMFVPFRLSPH